jgi:hypothetical protein
MLDSADMYAHETGVPCEGACPAFRRSDVEWLAHTVVVIVLREFSRRDKAVVSSVVRHSGDPGS